MDEDNFALNSDLIFETQTLIDSEDFQGKFSTLTFAPENPSVNRLPLVPSIRHPDLVLKQERCLSLEAVRPVKTHWRSFQEFTH